jgi:hypothetical protein
MSEYKVGYKKPPLHTQFLPGQSGNPGGRPRRLPTLRSDVEEELAEEIELCLGDQTVTVTKQKAVVKILVSKAVAGNLRATSSLISLIEATGNEEIGSNSTLQDQELLDAFVEREISRRAGFKGGNDAEQK